MAKKGTRKAAAKKAGKGPGKARKQALKRKRSAAPKARPKAKKAKAPKAKRLKSKAKARPAARAKKGTSAGSRAGGTGRESTLAQTPDTGRSVRGRTNPMPTKRSTGTPSGAGDSRRAPALERERKRLREIDETVPSPPSSLSRDRVHPSAARSGRSAMQHAKKQRTEVSPQITGGDVDADWEDAYAVGDEAPGGDNPTPDQDRVDDIGKALGIEYADNEELKAADKIIERDKHRWELDPASAEDYPDHDED
jgi:hypothetical protein